MIVVAVLGIVAAIAAPMFSATEMTKLTSAAGVLAADIDAARAESIAHAEDPRVIVFDDDGVTWYIAASSDTTTPINHPDTGLPYTRTLGVGSLRELGQVSVTGYQLDTSSETDDNKLGFGIYGQTDQTSDATITLGAGGVSLTLTIAASTGEVIIASNAPSAAVVVASLGSKGIR